MGEAREHRPKWFVVVHRLPGEGPDRLPGLPQSRPTADQQLVPGPDVHLIGAADLVLPFRVGGGGLHPGRVDPCAVDAAGDLLCHHLPLLDRQSALLHGAHPPYLHAVGVPVLKIHRMYVPPIPASRARVANICPYWVALRSPQSAVAFVRASVS